MTGEEAPPWPSPGRYGASLGASLALHAAALGLALTVQGTMRPSPEPDPPRVSIVFDPPAPERPAPPVPAPPPRRPSPVTTLSHPAPPQAPPTADATGGAAPSALDGSAASDTTSTGPASPPSPSRGATVGVHELEHSPPPYPAVARRLHQQGRVVVRVTIGSDGHPSSVTVGTSSGYPSLDEAAVSAVKGWNFSPALADGVPVDASADVPVVFRLEGT